MSDNIDMTLENLKAELDEIKLQISDFRKKGLDTTIADLLITNIPFKINLAAATRSYKDLQLINNLIGDVKRELESIDRQKSYNNIDKNNKNQNIKNEEDENINNNQVDKNPEIEDLTNMIEKLNKSLSENKLKEAKNHYLESTLIYNKLDNHAKKLVIDKLKGARSRLIRGY